MLKFCAVGIRSCIKTASKVLNQSQLLKSKLSISATTRLFGKGQTQTQIHYVNDLEEFDKLVINNDLPVIVDFSAKWCEPCHKLTPMLKEMFRNSKHIDLALVDVDTNMDLVEIFNVKAVPAILAFTNGNIVDKFIGLVDEKRIETLVSLLKPADLQSVSL
ncbi:thioredoxin-like [Haematobia irritans]|uniref:thioredoxin-like n=1 Tax=Haematobia irritans TaxID=7368 RepID=UPI003F4FAD80